MNNWAYNLDMLAQNGVLDFDAPAFVSGQKPRYVGIPAGRPSPYIGNIPKAPALNSPENDEFKYENEQNKDIVKNPSWKKWLFAGLAIGAIALAGFKHKSIIDWAKNSWAKFKNNFDWTKIKTFIVDSAKKVGNWIKQGWDKFKNLFK